MNGADYVREALSMIERDVIGPRDSSGSPPQPALGAAGLAARIGFSVQHFGRLFRSLTGESPADYILKRRLTEVARRILVEPTPASRIAAEAGWSDYETFSRAFKRHFGVSPSRAKAHTDLSLRLRDPIDPASIVSHPAAPLADSVSRLSSPRLCEQKPLHLAGLPFFMDESIRSFHRPWAIFCQAFRAAPDRIAGRICPERFCQFSSWLEDGSTGGLFILCALEIEHPDDPTSILAPFVYRSLPACTYVVFTHSGGLAGLSESYQRIYGEALASLEHKAAFPWEIQRYPSPDEIEIAIPIIRN
jgi:AraC family transcriptional regulator